MFVEKLSKILQPLPNRWLLRRQLTTTKVLAASQSGRFKVSIKRDNPLTYEQAHKPHEIGGRKDWNSFNTGKSSGREI